jgi:hypothetical protein
MLVLCGSKLLKWALLESSHGKLNGFAARGRFENHRYVGGIIKSDAVRLIQEKKEWDNHTEQLASSSRT